ncbi:hypothetical protein NQ314_000997, partial [Rhamnusium bicolor]
MDLDSDEENVIEEDFYSFLNVPKEASREEINNAYRRLSRMYHPDKHVDPALKAKAEVMFNKTKRAYEVLSDPHQRAIYDSLGTKGLETEGWEIVQRTKTPAEIRAEYEQLAEERAERRKKQATNPTGNVTIAVNATDLFNPYDDELFEDEYESILMQFTQSVDFPLTQKDTCTLSGQLQTQNGTGGGGVNLSWRHIFSHKSWAEVEMTAGSFVLNMYQAGTFGGVVEYGAEKKISKHSNLSFAVVCGVPSGVKLKIRLTRSTQTYSFPIHLCEEIMPAPIFYATVVPLVVYVVVKKGLVEPLLREEKSKKVEKQKQDNYNKLLEKRKQAMAAQELMMATYNRIRDEENNRKGLVIIKAIYGRIITEPSNQGDVELSNEVMDVTVPVQCLVKDSKLVIHDRTKSELPGFFDPSLGEEKMLHIIYNYHEQPHEVTVADNEPLRLPKT